jgi:hypothetical protein
MIAIKKLWSKSCSPINCLTLQKPTPWYKQFDNHKTSKKIQILPRFESSLLHFCWKLSYISLCNNIPTPLLLQCFTHGFTFSFLLSLPTCPAPRGAIEHTYVNIACCIYKRVTTVKCTVSPYITTRNLKGQCHEIFDPRFFSLNNTPWAPDSRAKASLILLRIRRDMIDFRTQKSCMRCQWHCMHENFLLGSPFKFIYFFSGGVGQFGNIYVSRSCMRCHILHAVSLTPHAFSIFFAYHRCFAYDSHFPKLFENFVVHAVSMTPHAF